MTQLSFSGPYNLIGATIALPLAQIIPLPGSLSTALPGRQVMKSSLDQISRSGGWMPLSFDPLRTLLALTALITPLAVLFAGWTLSRERLFDLGWMVVGLGLVTVLLGLVPLGASTDAGTIHGARAPGKLLLGTFANRNSTGLFLGFTLILAALLPAPRRHPAVLPVRLAVCVLLLVAIALTQSRTGIALAAIPVLLGIARGLDALRQGGKAPSAARAGAMIFAAPGRIGEAFERFEAKDDPRRFIWDDATYTAGRFWPVGTGMGTFDEIYQVDESLENLTPRRPGRAHNDYIELTIEAGAPGLVLAACWLVLIAWLSWRARSAPLRWAAWSGSAFLLAIALQSITDYPLRSQTILAFALLLLTRIAAKPRAGA